MCIQKSPLPFSTGVGNTGNNIGSESDALLMQNLIPKCTQNSYFDWTVRWKHSETLLEIKPALQMFDFLKYHVEIIDKVIVLFQL